MHCHRHALPLIAIFLAVSAVRTSLGCDYTVRDIGFVSLGPASYSIVLVGPETKGFGKEDQAAAAPWEMQLVSLASTNARELPPAIAQHIALHGSTWSLWVVDRDRRSLLLDSADHRDDLATIKEVIATSFDTPLMRELADHSLKSFAQVVLVDRENDSQIAAAEEAASSLKRLEPMLPRPISHPAHVIVVPFHQRQIERVLIWALGLDNLPNTTPALAILYGRGRMAGPALVGDEIQLRASIGQLALVGESCECETDRSWLGERSIPMFWDDESSRQAASVLGFDPGNGQVQAEIKKVLGRGSRNARPEGRPDQIERIVAGYFETDVSATVRPPLVIPPGRQQTSIIATVIAGSGWGFDENIEDQPESPVSGTQKTMSHDQDVASASDDPHEHSDNETQQPGDESSVFRIGIATWVAIVVAVVFAAAKICMAQKRK